MTPYAESRIDTRLNEAKHSPTLWPARYREDVLELKAEIADLRSANRRLELEASEAHRAVAQLRPRTPEERRAAEHQQDMDEETLTGLEEDAWAYEEGRY